MATTDKKSARGPRCPHCGSTAPKEDNGLRPSDPDYTLLCVTRVAPADWAFTEKAHQEDMDDDGKVACGMQWCPNA